MLRINFILPGQKRSRLTSEPVMPSTDGAPLEKPCHGSFVFQGLVSFELEAWRQKRQNVELGRMRKIFSCHVSPPFNFFDKKYS